MNCLLCQKEMKQFYKDMYNIKMYDIYYCMICNISLQYNIRYGVPKWNSHPKCKYTQEQLDRIVKLKVFI